MHFVNSVSKNTSNFDLETLYKPSQIAISTKFQLSLTNLLRKNLKNRRFSPFSKFVRHSQQNLPEKI